MIRPGTFERVYAAIKQQLRAGELRPGDRLEPALLSDQLNASVTPVRDALHRLTGERLVEAPRHEGFRVPLLTETMLRHLYAWHRDLLLLALSKQQHRRDGSATEADSASERREEQLTTLFLDLARATGNPEHVHAMEALLERVEPLRRLEGLLLEAVEEEVEEIFRASLERDMKALRRALLSYHRRRVRIVPQLLEQLQTS